MFIMRFTRVLIVVATCFELAQGATDAPNLKRKRSYSDEQPVETPPPVGVSTNGNMCFFIAVLQFLVTIPDDSELLANAGKTPLREVLDLYRQLQLSDNMPAQRKRTKRNSGRKRDLDNAVQRKVRVWVNNLPRLAEAGEIPGSQCDVGEFYKAMWATLLEGLDEPTKNEICGKGSILCEPDKPSPVFHVSTPAKTPFCLGEAFVKEYCVGVKRPTHTKKDVKLPTHYLSIEIPAGNVNQLSFPDTIVLDENTWRLVHVILHDGGRALRQRRDGRYRGSRRSSGHYVAMTLRDNTWYHCNGSEIKAIGHPNHYWVRGKAADLQPRVKLVIYQLTE